MDKNKSKFICLFVCLFEQERTRERQKEELVKRQRHIRYFIYSFNKYLLSSHHELKTGEYTLENKLDTVLSSRSLAGLLSFHKKWNNTVDIVECLQNMHSIPLPLCSSHVVWVESVPPLAKGGDLGWPQKPA